MKPRTYFFGKASLFFASAPPDLKREVYSEDEKKQPKMFPVPGSEAKELQIKLWMFRMGNAITADVPSPGLPFHLGTSSQGTMCKLWVTQSCPDMPGVIR